MVEPLSAANYSLSPPSAMATFSTLFLFNSRKISEKHSSSASQAVYRPPKSKPPSNGLDALPTEILMLIFQFVFETCVDWNKTGALNPEHATIWLEDDPLSLTLFPYSLASVCVRWLRILSCEAVYWTRQIFIVDSHATSLIAVQNPLQWVGNRPLQLIITRHPTMYAGTERGEHAGVQALLDLLHPRIHQVWSLILDVRCNSLLSALWREKGDAQYSGALTLMSGHPDASSIMGLPPFPVLHPAGHSLGSGALPPAPFLAEGALDGSLFDSALDRRNLSLRDITSLTTKNYTASNERRTSLHKFIATIQSLGSSQTLMVEDIAFVNDMHPLYRFRLEASVISLRNITDGDAVGSILSQSFGSHSKEAVTISNCPFSGFGKRSSFRSRIFSTTLTLEGVDASPSAIQQLVCFWNGENLSLINCPGVSASFLRTVPAKETPPKLRCLRIVDCEGASVGGLMSLVRHRELQSVIDVYVTQDLVEEPCEALVELHVHGRGPSIDTEQAAWFAEHLNILSWDTIGSDGTRYTWDATGHELIISPTYNC